MKPLGTITKDLPFLSESVKIEIEAVMNRASDYFDFVVLLSNQATNPNSDPQLEFIAWWHAMRVDIEDALNKLEDVHSQTTLTKPCFIPTTSENASEIAKTVDAALAEEPGDAVAFYLLLRVMQSFSSESGDYIRVEKEIEDLLTKNESLRAHSAYFIFQQGRHLRFEGDISGAYEKYSKALEITQQVDDQRLEAGILTQIAELEGMFSSRPESHTKAIEYLHKATDIFEALGDKRGLSAILGFLSLIAVRRGEFAEAIDNQLKNIITSEAVGISADVGVLNLTYYYSMVGEGAEALEWAKTFHEKWRDSLDYAFFANTAMVSAYLELDRLRKAKKHLEQAHELVLKHGQEMALGVWYLFAGLLDWKQGDLESAMYNLEQALDINMRANRQIRINWCLLKMSGIELDMFNPTKENRDNEFSGPWMKKYHETANERLAPGHFARCQLMKSELRMKQGRHSEADELIKWTIEFADKPTTKYLHKQAVETRESWIREGLLSSEESSAN